MNILLVHNYYKLSGGEDKVFESERNLLQDAGHTVLVYERHNRYIRIDSLHSKIRTAIETIWSKKSFRDIMFILKTKKPDIVHFHNTFPLISPAAYHACSTHGVPVVQTLHNYRIICPTSILYRNSKICEDCLNTCFPYPAIFHRCYRGSFSQSAVVSLMLFYHNILKTYLKQVTFFISLTDFARNKFIEGGLPENKLFVKPNFVYPPSISDGSKQPYALFVGRLSSEKGLLTLLRAWSQCKGLTLKIIGEGPCKNYYKRLAQSMNISDIEWIGYKPYDDVLTAMNHSKFLTFPSECYENFPRVVVEAFACGAPVISSNIGSTAEIVNNGKTGLHFKDGNAADLAAKLQWAWQHHSELLKMGKEARKEYERKYSPEINYKKLIAIYKSAISASHR
jgi:glycosyltransferase involved in cell wall biosynthesis